MSESTSAPSWAEMLAWARGFDQKGFERDMLAGLNTLVAPTPVPIPDEQAYLWARALDPVIVKVLGPWYERSCFSLWHEELDGGCLCHTFASALAKGPRAAVDHLAKQAGRVQELVSALADVYEHHPAPAAEGKRERAVAAGLEQVVLTVADCTKCTESWYHYLPDAMLWYLEAAGVAGATRRPGARDEIARYVEVVCSSWVEPLENLRRDLCRDVALQALLDEIDERYPPGGA